MNRQFLHYIVGALAPFIIAISFTPFIVRNLNDTDLYYASIAIMFNAMLGLFDAFRPILVRQLARSNPPADPRVIFSTVVPISFLICLVFFGLSLLFIREFSIELIISFTAATFVFLIASPLWAQLDATGSQGTAYLIRSLSVSSIYILIACVPAILPSSIIPWTVLVVNATSFILMMLLSRRLFEIDGFKVMVSIKEVFYVLFQNMIKVVVDYTDRIASSKFLSPSASSGYVIIADIPSRTNVISQILSGYFYPKICRDSRHNIAFALIGGALAFSMALAATLFWLFGEGLYNLYYGERLSSYFGPFCVLLLTASMYSGSFFCQSYLRSIGKDAILIVSFLIPAIIGASVLLTHGISIFTILISVVIFRSSTLIMIVMSYFSNKSGAIFLSFIPSYFLGLITSIYIISQI